MTPGQWDRIDELFAAALERPREQWGPYLVATVEDPDLSGEVLSLLQAHEGRGPLDSIADELGGLRPAAASIRLADLLSRLSTAVGDRYRIESELGRGGMAIVLLARDVKHRRKVALKVLQPDLALGIGPARFLQEIAIAARLAHPHILPLHDSGEADGLLYYVMPYVEGESLRERLRRKPPLSVDEALQIARQVADALSYAHGHGVIHRDIKPENILLADGHAVVSDFGIARAMTEAGGDELAEAGIALGTPAYMSPEQGTGGEVDGRSDLYSLGCVLYEMLASGPPFAGATAETLRQRHLTEDPPPLEQTGVAVPAAVCAVIRRALAKEPADRFATASHFAEALPLPGPKVPSRRRRARPFWQAAILASALTVSVGIGAWIVLGPPAAVPRRVAVLPFENIGGVAEQDYFIDGLTEEINFALSRLRNVRAISRTSTMRFEGPSKDPREIGRELGVEAVLEGTVRLTGTGVRITAQLIGTRTNEHLWSEVYERELTDIFDIQADIALRIAGSLDAELSVGEREAIERRPTHSPAAYREYLKGRHLMWGPDPTRAIEYLERAITLDSSYARAYAGLADLYGQLGVLGSIPPREALARAQAAADRAVALDPTLPEAHTARGAVLFWFAWDWEKASAAYQRASQLGRTGHLDHYVAYLMAMGRTTEAIGEAERRLELDPLGASRNLALAWTYFMAGRHEAAIDQLHRTLELHPGFAWAHVELAWNFAFSGRYPEAVAEARRAETLLGEGPAAPGGTDFALASLGHVYAVARERRDAIRILDVLLASARRRYVDPFKFAIVHVGLGDTAEALRWLERARAVGSPQMVYLTPMSRNFFATLRSEPRYRALQGRMRLPPG